jgi:hypothetical protein
MGREGLKLKIESPPLYSTNDRRAHRDRRKTYNRDYFLSGGKERRSWKERRFIWHMTR